MSEEMIKNLIARLNHNCSNACLNDASSCICTVNDIKDLIHLYNKEKEKNKSIEAQRLRDMCYKTDGNYISKDKIIELVRDYSTPKNKHERVMNYDVVGAFLNELGKILHN